MAQHSTKGIAFKAITANTLDSGKTVYLDAGGHWQEAFSASLIVEGQDAIQELLTQITSDDSELKVIGIYAFDVIKKDNKFVPASVREVIRAFGPSIPFGSDICADQVTEIEHK